MLTKTKVIQQIDRLPEEFTIDELVESLIFVNKVEKGLNDSNVGNKISENELENLIKKWVT